MRCYFHLASKKTEGQLLNIVPESPWPVSAGHRTEPAGGFGNSGLEWKYTQARTTKGHMYREPGNTPELQASKENSQESTSRKNQENPQCMGSSATPEAKRQEEHHGLKGEKNSRQSRFGPWPVKYRRRGDGYGKTLTPPSPGGGGWKGKNKQHKEQHISEGSLQPYRCVTTSVLGHQDGHGGHKRAN